MNGDDLGSANYLESVAHEAAIADGLIAGENTQNHSAEMAKARKAGLRRGKWTAEEEFYANRLIYEFKLGLLPLTDGTTLRTFLSKLLNCDPMRISKKFVGQNCIGKQVFRRRQQDLEKLTPEQIETSRKELAELERKFLERVAQSNRSKPSKGKEKGAYDDDSGSTSLAPWMIPPDATKLNTNGRSNGIPHHSANESVSSAESTNRSVKSQQSQQSHMNSQGSNSITGFNYMGHPMYLDPRHAAILAQQQQPQHHEIPMMGFNQLNAMPNGALMQGGGNNANSVPYHYLQHQENQMKQLQQFHEQQRNQIMQQQNVRNNKSYQTNNNTSSSVQTNNSNNSNNNNNNTLKIGSTSKNGKNESSTDVKVESVDSSLLKNSMNSMNRIGSLDMFSNLEGGLSNSQSMENFANLYQSGAFSWGGGLNGSMGSLDGSFLLSPRENEPSSNNLTLRNNDLNQSNNNNGNNNTRMIQVNDSKTQNIPHSLSGLATMMSQKPIDSSTTENRSNETSEVAYHNDFDDKNNLDDVGYPIDDYDNTKDNNGKDGDRSQNPYLHYIQQQKNQENGDKRVNKDVSGDKEGNGNNSKKRPIEDNSYHIPINSMNSVAKMYQKTDDMTKNQKNQSSNNYQGDVVIPVVAEEEVIKSRDQDDDDNSNLPKNSSVENFWMLVGTGDLPKPEINVLSETLWNLQPANSTNSGKNGNNPNLSTSSTMMNNNKIVNDFSDKQLKKKIKTESEHHSHIMES